MLPDTSRIRGALRRAKEVLDSRPQWTGCGNTLTSSFSRLHLFPAAGKYLLNEKRRMRLCLNSHYSWNQCVFRHLLQVCYPSHFCGLVSPLHCLHSSFLFLHLLLIPGRFEDGVVRPGKVDYLYHFLLAHQIRVPINFTRVFSYMIVERLLQGCSACRAAVTSLRDA